MDVTTLGQRQLLNAGDIAQHRRAAWLALIITSVVLLLPGPAISAMVSIAEPALDALRNWKNSWWPWPVSDSAESGLAVDKVVHTLLFLLCAFLSCRAWYITLKYSNIMLYLLLFAGFTELFQAIVPGRSMSLGDVVADMIGIVAGISIWRGCQRSRTIRGNRLTRYFED